MKKIEGSKIHYIHIKLPADDSITYSYHFTYYNKDGRFNARTLEADYIERSKKELKILDNVIFDTPNKIGYHMWDHSDKKLL